MKFLNQYPLLRLLIPYIIGIVIFLQTNICLFPFTSDLVFSLLIILIIAVILFTFFSDYFITYSNQCLYGIILSILLVCTGYFISMYNYDRSYPSHFSNYLSNKPQIIIADIIKPVDETTAYILAEVGIKQIKSNNSLITVQGKALIFFEKADNTCNLKYGDKIIINSRLKQIKDYSASDKSAIKKYYEYSKIYYSANVSKASLKVLSYDNGNSIIAFAYKTRDKFIEILSSKNIKEQQLAVGCSLIFGYRQMIDRELMNAYSNAGVIHILCVSGLNVGIIYIIFNTLFFFMNRSVRLRILKTIILLVIIWFYALITALSAPIFRAVVMFSFIIIGRLFNKNTNNLSSIIVSAFIILLFDPFVLFNIGFQLSYFAVGGICLFEPRITKLLQFDYIILTKIWQLAVVSFSANILVFPLLLFYFHSMSVYFIISNLLIVPLAFIITCIGVFLLFIFAVPLLSSFTAVVFDKAVYFMNNTVSNLSMLPFSAITNVNINIYQLILIYAVIILISIFIISKNKLCFFLSFSALLFIGVIDLLSFI